jgi:arginine utilization protein RocB
MERLIFRGSVELVAEFVTVEPKSLDELRQFLEENKDKYHEIWVIITNKKTANPQVVLFNQVINEARNQGLIDSRIKNVDEKRYMIRLTKRIKA